MASAMEDGPLDETEEILGVEEDPLDVETRCLQRNNEEPRLEEINVDPSFVEVKLETGDALDEAGSSGSVHGDLEEETSTLAEPFRFFIKEEPQIEECDETPSYSEEEVEFDESHSEVFPETKDSTSDEKAFQCMVCGETFGESKEVRQHMKKHVEKTLCCIQCNRQFSNSSHLRRHLLKHIHYTCKMCDKKISWGGDLTKHNRIHTGQRPYVCDLCKKSFIQKSHLTAHLRMHTGEKPFVCEVCKMSFTFDGNLKEHIRTHTGERPYVCEVCKKTFTFRGNLKEHMRTHTGERPYACEICKKSFSFGGNLKQHMRTHTVE